MLRAFEEAGSVHLKTVLVIGRVRAILVHATRQSLMYKQGTYRAGS
jgi:hypothetical protein